MTEARWLTPEAAARLLGVKEHHLPRLVKRGLVPAPSRHLGPRTPRYDRQALDSAMEGGQLEADADQAMAEVLNAIRPAKARRNAYRQTTAG